MSKYGNITKYEDYSESNLCWDADKTSNEKKKLLCT
jgi:hypothetical protein